jgi:hypothetical protein
LSQTKSNRNNPDRIIFGIWNTLVAAEILRSCFNWGPTYVNILNAHHGAGLGRTLRSSFLDKGKLGVRYGLIVITDG